MKNKLEEMTKEEYREWYLLPYMKKDNNRDLHTDLTFDDREFLVYFLMGMYKFYEKATGISLADCQFLKSEDLHCACDCKLCSLLWESFEKDNEKLVCKHCGNYHYIRKYIYEMNKEKYKKHKYNIGDYCFRCLERLEILDKNGKI